MKHTNYVPIGINKKPYSMEQKSSTTWGILCGISGGMGKYMLQMENQTFLLKLMEAGMTALICGLLGAAGKFLFDFAVNKFKRKP